MQTGQSERPPFPRTDGTYSVLVPQDTTQHDTTFREREREREGEREESLAVSGVTQRSMRACTCETCHLNK